jgi:hypothetical protein
MKDETGKEHSPDDGYESQDRAHDDAGLRTALPQKPDDDLGDKDGIHDGEAGEIPLPPGNNEGVVSGESNEEEQAGRGGGAYEEFSHSDTQNGARATTVHEVTVNRR